MMAWWELRFCETPDVVLVQNYITPDFVTR
jgi:hypothetical protein